MLEKDLFAWNAVDVLGSDGLFQRGHVVDKKDDELLVDFGIFGKEPEFFLYEKLVSTEGGRLSGALNGKDILFLYQLSADQPWTWYPAKALAGHTRPAFVLVDFIKGDLHIRDVFSAWRVRFPPEYRPYEAFWVEWVGKTCVSIPKELIDKNHKIDDKILLDLWKRVPDTLALGVERNQFSYIYDSMKHNEQSMAQLSMTMMNMAGKIESIQWKADFTADKKQSAMKTNDEQRNQSTKVNETKSSRRRHRRRKQRLDYTVPEDYSLSDLPYDVLLEVLNSVYSHERVGMRSVCHAWNDTIQSPNCSRMVHMNLQTAGNMGVKFGKCLFRCLSSFTKGVVLVGPAGHPFDSNCFIGPVVIDLVQQLVSFARAELNFFMLVDVSSMGCCLSNRESEGDFSLYKSYQSLAPWLHLYNVRMQGVLSHYFEGLPPEHRPHPDVVPDDDVYLDRYAFRTADPLDMRNIYDENCPDLSDTELEPLAVCIRDSHTFFDEEMQEFWMEEAMLEILKKWQHGDTRFHANCTWADIVSAQLDKVENLRSLRSCTLIVLLNFVEGCI